MARGVTVGYEVVIGLEIHVQMLTRTKMFCACPVAFGAPPNTLTCPVCLGLPGSLPVINRRAVELGLRTAVALNCTVHPASQFHRKNYYYPDLPKNYQITQYRYKVHPPLATDGVLEIPTPDGRRAIGIRRVHLEEDTGRLVHAVRDGRVTHSLVDYNRSGVPLMEIVTEPDLRSPQEARVFLSRLRAVLQALEVSTGRMEEGSLRCDANVSLRRPGDALGTRTEVKNMNSLRAVERALTYEVDRQRALLERGEAVEQETRHWDERREVTFASRAKEEAQDYRYFPEPDLVPIVVDARWLEEIRATLPELPDARRRRYVETFGLSEYDADLLTSSAALARFFEETVRLYPQPKVVCNWLTGDVAAFCHAEGVELDELPVTPDHLAEMLSLIEAGTISGRIAKEILPDVLRGARPRAVVEERGLVQISDEAALAAVVDQVLAEHPGAASEYRAGKVQALTFLVGQVMRRTRGRANPELVNRLLRERLGA
ncbi:MAG: Asp-tRNA(Asn)/Glu-tRNA(Gln) amidotransferase subunit GatB [Armatimonadota bacterium]|nr:Asp-tRNA(Asn)/Glu-tRNA(Gln) amidotransferase subunit GatB [Armatimonadota bacterium]MDR7404866.1 Asp-tRNA(Asn)/Glu-tRNA(Gln) amidotransferase subunit GatB [Armatimonadota bacterium]